MGESKNRERLAAAKDLLRECATGGALWVGIQPVAPGTCSVVSSKRTWSVRLRGGAQVHRSTLRKWEAHGWVHEQSARSGAIKAGGWWYRRVPLTELGQQVVAGEA